MSRSLFRQLKLRQIALAIFLPALVCACASQAKGQYTGSVAVGGGGDYGGVFGSATASFSGDCTGTDDDLDYYGEVSVSVADFYNDVSWIDDGGGSNSAYTGGQASPGAYTVTGSYSGFTGMDSNGNECSVSGDTEYVNAEVPFYPTETSVNLTNSSFQEDVAVTIPVVIANEEFSPEISGSVTLHYGPTALASANVTQVYNSENGDYDGAATLTASSSKVPPGKYSVYVSYSGDVNCAPSSSNPFTITILPSQLATSTTLAVYPNPIVVNEPLGITLTVKPTGNVSPTGTVTLLAAGNAVATIQLTSAEKGTASVSLPAEIAAGTYSLQALYSGDKFNLPSTSNQVSLTVDASTATNTTLTVSPATVVEGGNVELTVQVTPRIGDGVPTGTATFRVNGGVVATLRLANEFASLSASTAGFAPGSYSVTASYSGDATDMASVSATKDITIQQPTTVAVTASPNPVTQGTVTTLTATVKNGSSPVISGTISFSESGNSLGSASLNSSGVAQLPISTSALAPGTYTIQASFPGNSSDPPASGTVSLVVK